MSIDVQSLAVAYSKPVEYIERAIKFFDVKSIPAVRRADDGLQDFFSALTAFWDDTPSMTKPEFADECDINILMKRYQASGYDPSVLMANLQSRQAKYGDFTNIPESYHAAMNFVKDTERLFLELPLDFRKELDNDPQNFLQFIKDPKNADRLVELGLRELVESSSPRFQNGAVGDDDSSSAPEGRKESSSSSKAKKRGDEGE